MAGLLDYNPAQSTYRYPPQMGLGGNRTGGPYGARYPQNAGLAGLANQLHAQNTAMGLRGPVAPYQPSAGDPGISGVGRYGLGLQHAQQYSYGDNSYQGGLMTNQGAGLGYANTGYMPSKTVGGGYGLANPYAGRQPGYAPYSGQGGGAGTVPNPSYAPMNQAPLGIAPTTQAGYQQQMAQQNPGGQYYGGALPALGMSANGTQRPMWMAPPAAPQGAQQYSLPESRFIGGVRNYTDGSNLTRISQGDPQWQRMQDAQKMFDARRGGLAQRQQDYQQRTQADMASRRALVENNAYNKSQARKAGLGIGDPLDMAMRGNPDIAGAYGLANIGLQGQQMQNNLGLAALAQQQQQQQHQNMLGMMGHIAGMDLPPAVKQQYMNQIMGGLGLSAPMGGSGLTGTGQQRATAQLTPKQQGEYRALKTPQEREAWLNQNGIMDPVTRGYMLGSGGAGMGIQGYNPGLMQGIFDWITRPFEVAPTRPSRTRVIGLDGKPTTAPLRPLGLGSVPPAAGTPFQSDYMPMY